jgi:tagatose 1,6-diphosphate aldolase
MKNTVEQVKIGRGKFEGIQALSNEKGVIAALSFGYDNTLTGRLPNLIPDLSVRRLVERGAQGIKILVHYNPDDEPEINEEKHAFVERVGAECAALDVALFLEPIAYSEKITGGDAQTLEFARKKPEYVTRYMEEFSKPRYGVDVLKVEVPINMKFVSGTRSFAGGEAAYSREEALAHFRTAAQAASKPFIYLSAAVRGEIFRESLELAAEASIPYSGVLCGRATWQDGIPIYANEDQAALQNWLDHQGVENIQALNAVLDQGAKSIWSLYGGVENLEVV